MVATARSAATRRRVAELGLADQVVETNAAAVAGADLVIVCIPVGACGAVAAEIGAHLAPGAIVSDVGSVKGAVLREMAPHIPAGLPFVPAPRFAASDPTMWRDVFLANKDAVLETLGRFSEDLSRLRRAIRRGDGDTLFEHFKRTRAIRRGIVEIGQDSPAPDFGRPHPGLPHEPLPRPYSAEE